MRTPESRAGTGRRPPWWQGGPWGWLGGSALVLWMCADDASAAALGGVGTSVGLIAAVATWLLFKGWQAHLSGVGLPTFLGLVALAAGVLLLWRSAQVGAALRVAGPTGGAHATNATFEASPVALPAGVDRDRLVADLTRHFIDLQAAWDVGARETMSRLTTPDMLEELCAAAAAGVAVPDRTEVVSVDVRLLLFEERDAAQVVCVEFSGLVRESSAAAPSPFREFWMLTRGDDSASSWRLARHQAFF